jgi:hypothetical protein
MVAEQLVKSVALVGQKYTQAQQGISFPKQNLEIDTTHALTSSSSCPIYLSSNLQAV